MTATSGRLCEHERSWLVKLGCLQASAQNDPWTISRFDGRNNSFAAVQYALAHRLRVRPILGGGYVASHHPGVVRRYKLFRAIAQKNGGRDDECGWSNC